MFPVRTAAFAFQFATIAPCGLVMLLSLMAIKGSAAENAPKSAVKVTVTRDITYASPGMIKLNCDVYSPFERETHTSDTPRQANYPAVLVIHGGAWSSGSKLVVANYAMQLAKAGAVAIAIDYRHAPAHKFPAQVDDVRDALVWVHDHANEWNIDLERIGLFGYSAGGHLACMIATLVDEPLARVLETSQWTPDDARWKRLPAIKAVVAGGPPCVFTHLAPDNRGLEFFLGGSRAEKPKTYAAASPTTFASKGDCAVCFIHGERDFIVPIESSRSLFEAQIACGVNSEFVTIEKQGHMITFLHPKTGQTLQDYIARQLGMSR